MTDAMLCLDSGHVFIVQVCLVGEKKNSFDPCMNTIKLVMAC